MKNAFLRTYEQPETEEFILLHEACILSSVSNTETLDDSGKEVEI